MFRPARSTIGRTWSTGTFGPGPSSPTRYSPLGCTVDSLGMSPHRHYRTYLQMTKAFVN
jgi:hypothetical protein